MNSTTLSILLGWRLDRLRYHLLLAVCLFAATFLGYWSGLFSISGGLFIPAQAFVLGVGCAAWIGLRGGGLVVGWLAVYASVLGAHTQRGLFSYPGRTLAERIDLVLDAEALLVWAVLAAGFAAIAFGIGAAGRMAYRIRIRSGTRG